MVAFTPNRSYPYSTAGDPADVPAAMQSLAEAIDADVCAVMDSIEGREVARFRGTGTYSSPAASVTMDAPPFPAFYRLPFDTVDFDTVGVAVQSQDPQNRLMKPTVAGFYFAIATVAVPVLTVSGATVSFLEVAIHRGNATTPATGTSRQSGVSHNVPVEVAGDRNVRIFSTSSGGFFNGTTDAFAVEFRADTAPNIASYPIGERTLTILRMTQI